MVCLSICAWHSVLMGFNGSEEGPDAGACLRKCSRAESRRLAPPLLIREMSAVFSSPLILVSLVWISDEISYITDPGSFLQVHQSWPPPFYEEQMFGGSAVSGVPCYWWPPSPTSDPTDLSQQRERKKAREREEVVNASKNGFGE